MPRYSHITLALAMLTGSSMAAPVGTVLFTQEGSQIIDSTGVTRPAVRGAVLQSGERLQTPPGVISQVLMQDGSVMGVRPGTELRFDPATGNAPPVVALLQGSVRVIGAELMDARRASAMTLMSGPATLQLKAADIETTVIGDKQRGNVDPGSYSRLLTGSANIGKGASLEPLPPRQVSFMGPTTVVPVTVTSVSPELFGTRLVSPALVDSTKPITTISSPTLLQPVDTTKTLLPPPPSLSLATSSLTLAPVKTTVVVAPLPPPPTTITVITSPVVLPPPTKLPVISCKILGTC